MYILSLMSGSSLDGLDIGIIQIDEKDQWQIISPLTISYSKEWKLRLKQSSMINGAQLMELDADYARLLANEIDQYLKTKNQEINAISVHGHTVFHEVEKGYSFQLCNHGMLASLTNLPVIGDYRSMDMALGGQGAPLMAIVDRYLFGGYTGFLNLGGICNISIIDGSQVIAFDICPCNQLLNAIAEKEGMEFDKDGILASSGELQFDYLEKLNLDTYLKRAFPKSLSNQHVEAQYLNQIPFFKYNVHDLAFTSCQFISEQIFRAVKLSKIISNNGIKPKMLVSGGGAFNPILIEMISQRIAGLGWDLVLPERELIDYKELLLMGYLGYLKMNNKLNILSHATGATRDIISGGLYG